MTRHLSLLIFLGFSWTVNQPAPKPQGGFVVDKYQHINIKIRNEPYQSVAAGQASKAVDGFEEWVLVVEQFGKRSKVRVDRQTFFATRIKSWYEPRPFETVLPINGQPASPIPTDSF